MTERWREQDVCTGSVVVEMTIGLFQMGFIIESDVASLMAQRE